ncbi:MAG TPA: DUF308 domain-containing protein [Candidatus Mediterraneibacter gallistercoris]|uniref:DUF308 domain-containing protein n=1 Tax=Candidatus Mediterraneibacter gallistercoris TaxID=2838671 RepID=A0A9D2P1Q2_9FIRM|nr:DUF308 domain-containing protein [Candidatus Mediterraneibacter gallistercoris]
MRWFDSDFDYVQELIDTWNSRRKKIRTAYIIIAAVLLIAGILTAVFPVSIFAVMQYFAAAAVIVIGIYHFVTFASMTYYFRDYMLLLSGILNVLIGIMLFFMPVALTVQVITFLLAFLLIFSGAEKLSLASRLRYFRIPHTGSMTFSGVLNIILAVIFLLLPFVSALALNYILAAYLIIVGIALLIEAAGMHKISL